jgi:triacylglycerol esterase/lipase EstA (alpha/beta hydrolase family)
MPRPTVIVPGYFAQSQEYFPLEDSLRQQNIPAVTVPLSRWDWLPTVGGRSMLPILRKIDQTIGEVLLQYPQSPINVIGHSAGGWIMRIYLGDQPYNIHGENLETIWPNRTQVQTLVSLGTPHRSFEYWTRKNLNFVNENYPDAFYAHINYVCLAGKAVYGEFNSKHWLAYNSYKLTCGQGNTWGDGITPIEAAHLAGATNLILENVQHAPRNQGLWYGSPEILEQWIEFL